MVLHGPQVFLEIVQGMRFPGHIYEWERGAGQGWKNLVCGRALHVCQASYLDLCWLVMPAIIIVPPEPSSGPKGIRANYEHLTPLSLSYLPSPSTEYSYRAMSE